MTCPGLRLSTHGLISNDPDQIHENSVLKGHIVDNLQIS